MESNLLFICVNAEIFVKGFDNCVDLRSGYIA